MIGFLEKRLSEDYQIAVLDAIRRMKFDGASFEFKEGLKRFEEYADQQSDDERALILQDIAQWRKDWDLFVRSQPGGQ